MIKPINSFKVGKEGVNNSLYDIKKQVQYSTAPIQNDTITFTSNRGKLKELKEICTQPAIKTLDRARDIAQQYGANEIRPEHTLLACLESAQKYIEDLDSGKISYNEGVVSTIPYMLETSYSTDMFKKVEKRKRVKSVIDDEIVFLNKMMEQEGPEKKLKFIKPKLKESHLDTMYGVTYDIDVDAENAVFSDSIIFAASVSTQDDDYNRNIAAPFRHKIQEALMLDDTPKEEKPHIKFYDDKARKMWQNLAVGTNMFAIHDKTVNPQFLINSFEHIFKNDKEQFGKLNSENTDVVLFNKYTNKDYFRHKVLEAKTTRKKIMFTLSMKITRNMVLFLTMV